MPLIYYQPFPAHLKERRDIVMPVTLTVRDRHLRIENGRAIASLPSMQFFETVLGSLG